MSFTDWMVLAGGIAVIIWINWYFFVAGRVPDAATQSASRVPDIVRKTGNP